VKILKNAKVLTFNEDNDFGTYSILINENKITDMAEAGPKGQPKLDKWLELYSNRAEVIDCTRKLLMPPIVNSCVKSEGLAIHYLLKHRHYEINEEDYCTDMIFNYIYQELPGEEAIEDLQNIYNFSFMRQLKSGTTRFNEFSLRKDINHLQPISNIIKQTSQQVSVCYPITQDLNTIRDYKYLNPSFYLTQENLLNVYDISNITELKSNYISRLYLEVATSKEITDKFRLTFNKSVIALLNEYGLLDESVSLINPIYLSYDDLKLITDKGANIIVCPRDLAQFSNKYFPIDDYISHGIMFSIATGWLGEDIFKDVRLFRNRYKELNLTNIDLLNTITRFPHEMYFDSEPTERSYSIDINKTADITFIDLTDLRFQFFPESNNYEHVCDFIIDNLNSINISDVMIGGIFKVKDKIVVGSNEASVINAINETRDRIYRTGKYEEFSKRKERKQKSEKLDLRARDDEEIRLFSNRGAAEDEPDSKEDFRIKSKFPIIRKKHVLGQRNLFEELEQANIYQCDEFKETPELNLLVTEFSDSKSVEDELIQVKSVDETIIKRLSTPIDRKPLKADEKQKTPGLESKVELPKNVKLKFGD